MTRLALKEDHTTTGGRVLGGSADQYAEDGRPFALDGDKATCGNCKGLWPILGSAHDWMDRGRSMVKDLDPVHCPCRKNRVFASGNSPFDYETGGSSEPVQQSTPKQVYDEQFTLQDATGKALPYTYYTVQMPSGELRHGVTDSLGQTERYETEGAQRLMVLLGHRESI
jgi:PAAR motif